MRGVREVLILSTLPLALGTSGNECVAADAAAPAAAGPNADAGVVQSLEEVVVTAEKRPSTLQKTPAAVTAISGDALLNAGVTSPLDVAKLIPDVTFRTRGPVTQMFIRGVGSNIDSPQVLPGVATQMNQVYIPREATGGSFYDLQNVELLPGPQGTLYGRDAAGGTVNINFNRPTNSTEASALLEAGNYSLLHATAVGNAPITQNLLIRGAFDTNHHSGYLTNGSNDLDSNSGRLSILAKPTADLSMLLWASYWRDGGHGPEVVANPLVKPDNPWYEQPGVTAGTSEFTSTMAGGQLDWQLGNLALTYIPGYAHFHEDDIESFASPAFELNSPAAAFNLHIRQTWHNASQELRSSGGDEGPLTWLAALYWYSQTLSYDRHSIGLSGSPVTTVITIPEQTNSGYAGYGQLTYSPSGRLHLTAGGRAASDKLDVSGVNTGALVPFSARHDWGHGDWKFGAQLDVTDSSNIYATVQTGFLRGGYSPGAISPKTQLEVPTTLVQPEKLLSYTAGSKNRFLNGRLQVNDEFYYYDYKAYQISAIDLTTNVSSFLNANKAVIYGNQLDTTLLLGARDELNLSVAWSHARATDFNIPNVGNFTGYALPNSPDLTVVLSYQHTWSFSSGGSVAFRGDTHYETASFLLYNHPNGSRQPAYSNSGVSLTYSSPRSTWDVGLWAKNLENTAVYGAGATVGPIGAVYLDAPRTFGVKLGFHY